MIYKTAINDTEYVYDSTNVFDGKANVTVKNNGAAIVFFGPTWTSINTNISLTANSGYGSISLMTSENQLQLVSNNVSKNFSVKFTTNENEACALGIFSEDKIILGNSPKDFFRSNISSTASALYAAGAYGVESQGTVDFAKLAGTVSANATAKQDFAVAVATGIGGLGITGTSVGKTITATAKGAYEANAYGITTYAITDEDGEVEEGFDISIGEIAAAMNITATATYYVAANAINSSKDLYLGDIKGAITCKGTGMYADVEAIHAQGDVEIDDIAKAVTATATAKPDGEAEAAIVSTKGHICIDSVYAALKVTATNGNETEARVFESKLEQDYENDYASGIMITEIKQALSATATTAKGFNAIAETISANTSALMIDSIGAAISATAKAQDIAVAAAITGDQVRIWDIDKNISATATADEAIAFGIKGNDWANIEQINGNISAIANGKDDSSTFAAALSVGNGMSIGNVNGMSIGNVKGTLSATAAKGTAAGINSDGDIDLYGDINKIQANGLYAYGIYAKDTLSMDELYVEKGITVTGKNTACGIKAEVFEAFYNSVLTIDADISVTATDKENTDATGIEFNYADCDTLVYTGSITAKSTDGAYGIYCYGSREDYVDVAVNNLRLDGAKIDVKTSSKDDTPTALFIGAGYDVDTTVKIINKSTVVGDIWLGNNTDYGTDKVIIESGSKVTGAFTGVEEVQLVINDVNTKKNALWQNIDGSDEVDLNIDFERGMTGEFALCTRKDTDEPWWIDANDDGIKIQFGINEDDYIELANYIGATAEDGLYKYELVENKKGNTLSLAVSVL